MATELISTQGILWVLTLILLHYIYYMIHTQTEAN
jgi:hypothetical protein